MYPVLFEIPGIGFPLRSFGVSVLASFLLGVWVWGKLLSRYGRDPKRDPERSSQVAFAVLIGIILGARLMYVVVEVSRYLGAEVTEDMASYLEAEPEDRGAIAARLELNAPADGPSELERARRIAVGREFLHDPLKVAFIWEGGLVMYGGMFGAVVFGLYSSRKHGLHLLNALDTGLTAGFFGQMVGRWGCYFVGDDYGAVVEGDAASLPFPITLQVPDLAWLQANPESLFDHDLAGKTLWATQIWLSINALIIGLVAVWLFKRRRYYGQVAAWILVHYSITRFVIEAFRGDEIRGVWFGGVISTSQLIAIPGALIGAWVLWRFRARRDEFPSVT